MFFRRKHNIDPSVIEQVIDDQVALANQLDPAERQRLTDITLELLERKHWEGVRPLEVTDEMKIVVAANAAIPLLALDTGFYRNVKAILIMETAIKTSGARGGPARGVISTEPVDIIGQASQFSGPLTLAWDASLADSQNPQSCLLYTSPSPRD